MEFINWKLFLIAVALLLILSIVGWTKYIPFYVESYSNCNETSNLTLKSVNGIEDINTGLFSGGSVYRKHLQFENGLILTLDDYSIKSDLILNETYVYKDCIEGGGILFFDLPWEKEYLTFEEEE